MVAVYYKETLALLLLRCAAREAAVMAAVALWLFLAFFVKKLPFQYSL